MLLTASLMPGSLVCDVSVTPNMAGIAGQAQQQELLVKVIVVHMSIVELTRYSSGFVCNAIAKQLYEMHSQQQLAYLVAGQSFAFC